MNSEKWKTGCQHGDFIIHQTVTIQEMLTVGEKVSEKMKQPDKLAKEMLRYFTEEEIRVDSKRERMWNLVSGEENGNEDPRAAFFLFLNKKEV